MARFCHVGAGRACPLCPGNSDFGLFHDRQGIVDLDAEVFDSAFDLGMAKEKLHGPQIASASVDQGRFGSSERMCPEQVRIRPDASYLVGHEPPVLPGCQASTWTTSAHEEELAGFLAGGSDVVRCTVELGSNAQPRRPIYG